MFRGFCSSYFWHELELYARRNLWPINIHFQFFQHVRKSTPTHSFFYLTSGFIIQISVRRKFAQIIFDDDCLYAFKPFGKYGLRQFDNRTHRVDKSKRTSRSTCCIPQIQMVYLFVCARVFGGLVTSLLFHSIVITNYVWFRQANIVGGIFQSNAWLELCALTFFD